MIEQFTRYALFSQADETFYEAPEHLDDDDDRFAQADRPPPGWQLSHSGLWVELFPGGEPLPDQGWKVHVSATLADAHTTVEEVFDYCVRRRLAFKFLRGRRALHLTNAKYAPRSSSGKLITVYPPAAELRRTLEELSALLRDRRGPYILTDLRWDEAPVFVRYGGFRQRHCVGADGRTVPAVEDPGGRLVPDSREPCFRPPSWAPVPGFLTSRMAERDAGRQDDFPYEVDQALHHSNGGGVYVGRDRRTGTRVLLKEARPLAGLDGGGADAVTRLQREHDTLRRLAPLGFVPAVYDYRTWWEHHFLIMEYIPGKSLYTTFNLRFPGIKPRGHAPGGARSYTVWALEQARRVEDMLREVHEAGIVYGDLHPHNIIVRAGSGLAFVDFEAAFPVGETQAAVMGAPGFAAPPYLRGPDIDRHAFGRLLLWLFAPLTMLLDRDPGKLEQLLDVATSTFPLPEGFAERVRDHLPASDGRSVAASPPVADPPGWDAVQASVARGILASATPGRDDRLYPGDPEQFHDGGIGLAHGAAGVVHALHACGVAVPDDHLDWLTRRALRLEHPRPGLYDGLHGAAWTLHRLGRHHDARRVLDRALRLPMTTRHLYGGLAGAILSLVYFAEEGGERELLGHALAAAEQLAGTSARPAVPGLMHGGAGEAMTFARLYEVTGDAAWLDPAAAAIRRDLSSCERDGAGALQMNHDGRLLPYLAGGSAGLAVAVNRLLRHRADEELAQAGHDLRRACDVPMTTHAGLFTGRAGIIHAQRATGDGEADPAGLLWHASAWEGHLAFPGDQLLRLSMDLATGSAGVLLVLPAATPREVLPLLGPVTTATGPLPAHA
ncbi:class III lanthionine synthetase LanKC [Nonomuraea sp. NPDC050547]|uniref:class III lanthionine synthetase LanKC n=1 Tax=Nonomuraea sp. NPDC050547 TaxID=3364368 RepID=UPI0037A1D172